MSPLPDVGVFEAGIAVVERDSAIESLIELDFCSGKTEAAVLGRDLHTSPVPLHDVVVADDAFVAERTDALEIVGSGPPGLGGLARSAREAAVVVGDELARGPRWPSRCRRRWPNVIRCASDLAARPRDVRRGLWLGEIARR